MQNPTTTPCPIEQQLCKVEASAHSNQQLNSFLYALKNIISNLIKDPSDKANQSILKNDRTTVPSLFSTEEARELLLILGYSEEQDSFVYQVSDENIIKLTYCLRLLEIHIQRGGDAILSENAQAQVRSKVSKSQNSSFDDNNREGTACSGKMKELYLSKHLKKEHADMMGSAKRETRTAKVADFAFNNTGYFQQSCNNSTLRESRRNRCFMKELFHQSAHKAQSFSSGYNAKLF